MWAMATGLRLSDLVVSDLLSCITSSMKKYFIHDYLWVKIELTTEKVIYQRLHGNTKIYEKVEP